MHTFISYRTCISRIFCACASLGAVLALAACDSLSHDQAREEQTRRWKETRLGVMVQLATQQYQVGDYDKCRETLRQAFSCNQPCAPMEILAARLDLEKGTLESAAAHLKSALQTDAANPEPYYLLGVVYQRWQNPQAAHDYYRQAWEKAPGQARYLLAEIEMKLALGQQDEAQKLLEEKLVYFEQTAAVRAALARIAALRGDYAAAGRYYGEATILDPDSLPLRQNYAETLFAAGRYADALPLFESLAKAAREAANKPAPDPGAADPGLATRPLDKANILSFLGRTYLNLHRAREACNCFAEVCRDLPHDNVARLNLGQATLQLDDYAGAVTIARHMLQDSPDHVPALLLLAVSQQKLQQWQDAAATLARAHELAPKDGAVLCLLGLSAQHLGQPDAARQFYTRALDLNPNDPLAQQLVATVPQSANSAP